MKYFLCFALFFSFLCTNAQWTSPRPSYRNLEKYWFYRYRLVNDFMLIGDDPGMSIPAASRATNSDYRTGGMFDEANTLAWSDATIPLGHYISTLATEWRQLDDQGLDTWRTEYELDKAIHAVERLDKTAEEYCWKTYVGGSGEAGYPGTIAGIFGNPGTPTYGYSQNGFFIRDDVPYMDFVSKNAKHFNRPAMDNAVHRVRDNEGFYANSSLAGFTASTSHPTGGISDGSFFLRYTGTHTLPSGATQAGYIKTAEWATGAPKFPSEESQDQLCEIFTGLALTAKFVHVTSLQSRAKNEISLAIKHTRGTSYPHAPSWKIKNPVSDNCVYGTGPSDWGTSLHCMNGGALFFPSAPPATASAFLLDPTFYNSILSYEGNVPLSLWYLAFNHTQLVTSDPILVGTSLSQGVNNLYFQDNYAAFAPVFTKPCLPGIPLSLAFICPLPNTWSTIVAHSVSGFFASPTVPLVFQWNYLDPGIEMVKPELYITPFTTWRLPTYQHLLDAAPFCGIHNYHGSYGDKEWSGPDRLCDPRHRDLPHGGYYGNAFSEDYCANCDRDYNGVDWMFLFNLYSHVQHDYLPVMFNSYYERNFTVNYPDPDGLGSYDHILELHYLEYLELHNTIASDGHVIFRCGMQEILNADCQAHYGSTVVYKVEDYDCDHEIYGYAYENGSLIEYTPSYSPYLMPAPFVDSTAVFGTPSSTAVDTIQQNYTIDSAIAYIKENLQNTDPSVIEAFVDKVKEINNPELTKLLIALDHQEDTLITNGNNEITVLVYPNPNDGAFKISISVRGDYKIHLCNVLGEDLYSCEMKNQSEKKIDLHNLPPGFYFIKIVGNTFNYTSKITVVK
ncbi:MAG: T9SS type A sorting domain-containing protein [Chitinophagales bacterium]|nr:T9SS type A sorting domain-containing protein [Chitinophagales bacterium]